ncbi:proline dehydrogenase [Leekyejoonella antrihumi]|uniref:proline dehydrogenase n=1 Tax=Leekyejoonella antrihumi TaxID=1660198 RepID=A0A563DWZ9_9MICO|nr:proline dehydrogenase family protein [Leekyejoonella antrihumi]TWP34747.1 proline dehydrogenase [Leekyejoonella antrihumi]
MDPSTVLRAGLLGISKSDKVKNLIENAPVSRGVVNRFVAGARTADAVSAVVGLQEDGRLATVDFLGEDTLDRRQASATRDAYLDLLSALSDRGLTANGAAEVSLKLSALGLALGADGEKLALEHARQVCELAATCGTTVTLDMEDYTTTDATLSVLRDLRADFPWVGAVLQAYLHRTESDCRDLATADSRVRLCKGAYKQPESVAYQSAHDVDLSYVRCLKVLMEGEGYPMVASHDPRLIAIASSLAGKNHREPDSFEYQMLYGIRPDEQRRLAKAGHQMRIYVPYGDQWYGYLVRRMAERPANTMFFLRAVATKK